MSEKYDYREEIKKLIPMPKWPVILAEIESEIKDRETAAVRSFAEKLRKELWEDLHNAQEWGLKDHVMSVLSRLLKEETGESK